MKGLGGRAYKPMRIAVTRKHPKHFRSHHRCSRRQGLRSRDQCAPDTQKAPLTSDFGVRQSNNDDWLKVVSDDKIGPALLEDPFGREKVLSFPAKSSFTLLTLSDPPVRP